MGSINPEALIIITIIANCVSSLNIIDFIFHKSAFQDANLNFTGLAEKYGHKCEQYRVTTEDNYIVTVFNIVGNRSRPVFLLHGCLEDADSYIIRGRKSLAISLADAGYDVWLGNYRGSKYSRHHLNLDPDTDKRFWDFSFHEIGIYDLPATIDFILNKTGTKHLQAIGFSQGTTAFYVLCSKRPEYNEKIKIFVSLAPVAYLQNVERPVLDLINMEITLSDVTRALNKMELFAHGSEEHNIMKSLCAGRLTGYLACAKGILFPMAGFDEEELEPDFWPVLMGHFPDSTSRKNAKHLAMLRKNFTEYDYGSAMNFKVYNCTEPPEYDLGKVTVKVALLVGKNDRLAVTRDVETLSRKLPNVVEHRVMDREKFNHMDFVWGKNMDVYLFPHVFKLLEQYN